MFLIISLMCKSKNDKAIYCQFHYTMYKNNYSLITNQMKTDYFKTNSWKYTFVINKWYCTSKYEMRFNYLPYDITTVKILYNCKTVHISIVTILGVFLL